MRALASIMQNSSRSSCHAGKPRVQANPNVSKPSTHPCSLPWSHIHPRSDWPSPSWVTLKTTNVGGGQFGGLSMPFEAFELVEKSVSFGCSACPQGRLSSIEITSLIGCPLHHSFILHPSMINTGFSFERGNPIVFEPKDWEVVPPKEYI